MVDLVIFAAIAVFVVFKLKKMLGEEYVETNAKTQNVKDVSGCCSDIGNVNQDEGKKQNAKGILSSVRKKKNTEEKIDLEAIKKDLQGKLTDLSELKIDQFVTLYKSIPSFTYENFIFGACHVFEDLISAYSNEDIIQIAALSKEDVVENFTKLILTRKNESKKEIVTVIKINQKKIIDIQLNQKNSNISVEFESTQSSYIINTENNEIIEGDKSIRHNAKEIWQFTRENTSDKLDWYVTNIEIIDFN